MRLRIDWKLGAGSLAALAMLALSAPGVRVVRAEETVVKVEVRPIAEGPSCQLEARHSGTVEVKLAPDRAADADSHAIALNNRGYGYQSQPVSPEPIER